MNFNAEEHLQTTDLSVSFTERDGRQCATVTVSRAYSTTVEDLWDIVTNPERLPRFFTNVTGDLQEGGRYQVQDNASGTITECKPQSHFDLTWEIWGDVSWVSVRVEIESPDLTRATLSHTSALSEHYDTYGPGATGVAWEMATLGLAFYVADPNVPDPDLMKFATSPDGIAFITGSSNKWAKAAINAGTDPQTAQNAADKTTAFYTGQE